MAISVQDASRQLRRIQDALGQSDGDLLSDNERNRALTEAKQLVLALEKPEEVVMRYGFELGSHRMSIRVAIALRIFHILMAEDGTLISAAELAKKAGAELLLIIRIMRVLTAVGFAAEAGKGEYIATPLTKAMTLPSLEASVITCHDLSALVEMRMHDYFRENGYKCPIDARNCAFQWTFQTKQTYFEYVHQHQYLKEAFNTFMSGVRSTRHHWTEWYPVESELLQGFTEGTLLIDVGGNRGHDLETFLSRFPKCKGQLILQDLPSVVDRAPDYPDYAS